MNLTAVLTAAGAAFVLGRFTSRHETLAARREANTDALTLLTNRAGLMRQLHKRATASRAYTVFLLDLNEFKPVNDTYGHRTGDDLLVALAARLRADYPDQLVARLGGDEFVVVLDGIYPREQLGVFADRLAVAIARPIRLPVMTQSFRVTAAVGAANAHPAEDPRLVLHAADQAMYRSKQQGVPQLNQLSARTVLRESPRVRLRESRRVDVAPVL